MKINKEAGELLMYSNIGTEYAGYTLVAQEYVGAWRWGDINKYVVSYEDKLYAFEVQTSSGDSDYDTFDDFDEIDLVEVKPVEKIVITYEKV